MYVYWNLDLQAWGGLEGTLYNYGWKVRMSQDLFTWSRGAKWYSPADSLSPSLWDIRTPLVYQTKSLPSQACNKTWYSFSRQSTRCPWKAHRAMHDGDSNPLLLFQEIKCMLPLNMENSIFPFVPWIISTTCSTLAYREWKGKRILTYGRFLILCHRNLSKGRFTTCIILPGSIFPPKCIDLLCVIHEYVQSGHFWHPAFTLYLRLYPISVYLEGLREAPTLPPFCRCHKTELLKWVLEGTKWLLLSVEFLRCSRLLQIFTKVWWLF